MEKIIARRIQKNVVGFKTDQLIGNNESDESLLRYVGPQDIRTFGLIPELIGRLPIVTYLEPLDRQALHDILVKPKNALIKQYQKLFDMEGIALNFTEEAIALLVDKAVEFKLGARGLRSICEAVMTDAMFELPSHTNIKSFEVTAQYVQEKLSQEKIKTLRMAS